MGGKKREHGEQVLGRQRGGHAGEGLCTLTNELANECRNAHSSQSRQPGPSSASSAASKISPHYLFILCFLSSFLEIVGGSWEEGGEASGGTVVITGGGYRVTRGRSRCSPGVQGSVRGCFLNTLLAAGKACTAGGLGRIQGPRSGEDAVQRCEV